MMREVSPLSVARPSSSAGSPLLLEERRRCFCTDLPCCFIFLVALLVYGSLAAFGIQRGNTELLENFASGVDYKGRRCGHSAGVENFRKTYFTLPVGSAPPENATWTDSSRSRLKSVCTMQCPESSSTKGEKTAYVRQTGLCPTDAYTDGICTWYGAATLQVTGYCVDPGVFEVYAASEQWLQDLQAARYFAILAFAAAIICGFVFLGIVRRCGHVIVLLLVIVIASVPLAVGCLMYFKPEALQKLSGKEDLTPDKQKTIAYWLWVASAALFLLACLFASTIRNVVAVLRATSTFLQDVPSQLVQPVLFAVLQLVVLGIWLVVFLAVSTLDAKEKDHRECLTDGDLFCIQWNTNSHYYAILFLILMLYWMVSFFHALSHFGTAYAVKAWYFTHADPITGRKVPAGSRGCCGCGLTVRAIAHGIVHHTGSLAMGAFLVALAKVASLLLCWARHTDPHAAANPVVACIYRISLCAAKCVERFVEFVSEHAYVEMALKGTGFVRSAQEALAMAVKKPGLFAVSGSVSRVIQFLGLVVVTVGTALVTFFALELFPPAGLTSLDAPLVASALIGLLVAEVMMHPFSTAARASLHCVVMDEESAASEGRSGTILAPQHMQLLVQSCSSEERQRGGMCPCCCS